MINIMIVDDHPVFLDSLGLMLGFEPDMEVIEKATSAEKALEILKKRNKEVDVLLLDYNLKHGMNGLEASQIILSEYPAIKIIMLTSFEDGEIIGQMIETNASGYVLKDEATSELRKAIRKVSQGKTHFGMQVMEAYVEYSRQHNNLKNDYHFTPKELEVLDQVVLKGRNSREIAQDMNIKESTVISHRKSISKKLNVHNTAELVREAILQKIVTFE